MKRKAAAIENAYVAVEVKCESVRALREFVRAQLSERAGVACEDAAHTTHVSIAYGNGATNATELRRAASRIARKGFRARASGLELLEGKTTPYDYLVLTLEADGAIAGATAALDGHMNVKSFDGGFRHHVSLLRFPKGRSADARALIGQLSGALADWLSACVCVEGACVCVYDSDRESVLEVPIFA